MQLYTTFTAALFLIFSLRSAAIRRRDDAFTHHEPSAVRNRLPGTISDIRTISNFPDGVNRHSPQIQSLNFNSTAVIPDVSGTFWHPISSHECTFSRLARSLTATCCFARVHTKGGSPCPQYMFCRHSILFIIYVFPSSSRQDFLSLLRSPRYQSAERQKRQNIRNDHKPVEEVR